MVTARELHPPAAGSATLWLCAALAVAAHGALLFAWKMMPEESAASAIEGDSVEVALVESAPAAVVGAEPQPPVTPVEPVPPQVPPPEPPTKEPEMTLPDPPEPTPAPRPASAATPPPKAPPPTRRTPSPRVSTSAGATGGATANAGTSPGGTSIAKSAKPSYVIRPVAAYPPESRAAREHGVVILRLIVDGNGRPTSVTVARSSGYPRLDRAAVEAGWRCRVRDAAAGARFDAPVRFHLTDR